MENATPMLRQYLEIKKLYPGTLLMSRLGDFYELFDEDAIIGSRELDITLTARHKASPNPIPMCGVPHHAAANYISRLVKKGYRVAICEQTEVATKGVKLVKRQVVRVITPGTAVDPQLMESKESLYLAAICGGGEIFGAAFLELSTGDFSAAQFSGSNSWEKVREQIEGYAPREILFPESLGRMIEASFASENLPTSLLPQKSPASNPALKTDSRAITLTPLDDSNFHETDAVNLLMRQFKVNELTAFGLEGKTQAIRAAGACLRYAHGTQGQFTRLFNHAAIKPG